MKSLWSHLAHLFVRQQKAEGSLNAGLMLAGAVRALLFQRQHRELLRLEIIEKYIVDAGDPDVLFHLSHRHYLSNDFSQRDRIDCALTHYRYEGEQYDSRYKDAVYGGRGLVLWSSRVDEVDYALKLRATTDLRHEGGVSVVLCAGDIDLSEMSFSWVDGSVLGLKPGTLPFITRNQSLRHDTPAMLGFRAAFPQNSPPYFCLAAVHGVASAHSARRLAAIRHEYQVAFETRYAQGFRNSYCEFWKSFGAEPVGRMAYVMPVPLATPAMAEVKSKHRKRAQNRRRHWAEISESCRGVAMLHLPALRAVAPAGRATALGVAAAQLQTMALLFSTVPL